MNNTEELVLDLEFEGYKSTGSQTIKVEDKPIFCITHSLDDLNSLYPMDEEHEVRVRHGLSSDVRIYPH